MLSAFSSASTGTVVIPKEVLVRELPDPRELPEGTETVVKVQRPLRDGDLSWMVFAQERDHLRLYKAVSMPGWLVQAMHGIRKAYFRAVVHDGEWVFLERVEDRNW
jgi:hypothetical protein